MTAQPSQPNAASPPSRPLPLRLLRGLLMAGVGCGLALLTAWAAAALYFDVRIPALRVPLAVVYLLAVLAVWILARGRWLKVGLTELNQLMEH